MRPTCFIVAGPNGAGKSSFAKPFLPSVGCLNFINADLIAAGLSPLQPHLAQLAAGRLLLSKFEEFVKNGETFGLESTLSGTAYSRRISAMKHVGYRVVIFYLRIESADLAVARVAERVKEGGHFVPEDDIRRRFDRSWKNFNELYKPLADRWIVFENSTGLARVQDEGGE